MPAARVHCSVLFIAGDDLEQAAATARAIADEVNKTLDDLFLDLRTIDRIPPEIDPERVRTAYAKQVEAARAAIIVLGAALDERTAALLNLVRERASTRGGQPFSAMVYVVKRAIDPDDNEALSRRMKVNTLRDAMRKAGSDVRDAASLDDLRATAIQHLIALARTLAHNDSGNEPAPIDVLPYLAFLEKRYGEVELPGLSGQNARRVQHDLLFIEPRFRARPAMDREKHGDLHPERTTIGIAEVLARSPLLAITGDPGSGKTTILIHLALAHARARSDGATPIFINLRELADRIRDVGRGGDEEHPLATWGALLEGVLGKAMTTGGGTGERLLQAGGLFLLFDGLDEVSGSKARARLARAISALACAAPGTKTRPNRYAVTCRKRAWSSEAAFAAFEEVTVEPFDDAQIAELARRWCGVVERDAGEADARARGLIEAILGAPPVRRIATNPQMLTMLAILYSAKRQLPEQRALLYDECIKWLVERYPARLEPYGGARAALGHLAAIASAMQNARDEEGRVRDALDRDEVIRLLTKRAAAAHGEEVLETLELYTGIVVADGAKVSFHHRTFQEFFVARAIADADDPAGALGERLLDPQWIEVAALTAGVLAIGGEQRLRTFLGALAGETGALEARAPRIGVAAQCLEDLEAWKLPAAILAPLQKALDEVLPVLEDKSQRIEEKVRIAIGDGLGRTRDPRLRASKRWIEIPAGRFWRGAAKGDREASDNEKPGRWIDVPHFSIMRWPVTVFEMQPFVEMGYEDEAWWDEEGWAWRTENGVAAPDAWERQREKRNHPVTGVSWWEARAFAAWWTKTGAGLPLGTIVRLPNENESEKAARGGEELAPGAKNPEPQRLYPWTGKWNETYANGKYRVEGTTPVGVYPAGHGPYGAWDQAGNVWEWCEDSVADDDPLWPKGQSFPAGLRVVRGGGFGGGARSLRVSYRGGFEPGVRFGLLGFRCAASLSGA